jgi:hypothetical protein
MPDVSPACAREFTCCESYTMPIRKLMRFAVFATAVLIPFAANAQTEPKLKARELFYTPVSETTSSAVTKTPETKPTEAKTAVTTQTRVKKTVKKTESKPYTQEASTREEIHTRTESSSRVNDVPLVQASTNGIPLALRYSIGKRTEDGDYKDVATDTVFHNGDRVRLSVEANDAAYLYIVQQGSSHTWTVLFPAAEIDGGNNQVARNVRMAIPSKGRFSFNGQPGTERLFIVLTRQPEGDLDKLIYDLSSGAATNKGPAMNKKVHDSGAEGRAKPMMIASNIDPIDDAMVNRLRTKMISRDLVFEKVDDETEPGAKEKAVYVGTPDTSSSARIVADVVLNHQ